MKQKSISGLIVPLPTPLNENLEFENRDYEKDIENVLNELRDKGYECFFVKSMTHYHLEIITAYKETTEEIVNDLTEAIERMEVLTGRAFAGLLVNSEGYNGGMTVFPSGFFITGSQSLRDHDWTDFVPPKYLKLRIFDE